MTDVATYWDERWLARTPSAELTPNPALLAAIADEPAGRALELGCGHGDASLVLALQGWQVTAVDVSQVALDRVQARAAERGVDGRVRVARCDLAEELPGGGPYDLVAGLFFQSTLELPRIDVLRAASALVAPGGLLLDVTHGAPPPWAPEHARHTAFPGPQEVWDELGLDPAQWTALRLDQPTRPATGPAPDHQHAELQDTVVLARRTA